MDTASLLAKYDRPTPRYTSYPTAPHFSAAVQGATVAGWLGALPDAPLSLYLHVPFCAELCWFCGCHTQATKSRAAVEAYAETLEREITLVSAAIGRRAKVAHIHWGGGSPTILPPEALERLMAALRAQFDVLADAEVAIEVDPRTAAPEMIAALGRQGFTRASLGVQDFNPLVQQAINRRQSFAQTRDCAEALRAAGIGSINLDLVYGLPHQTVGSVEATVRRALSLRPDRVAVFGYAHVPWMKKHMKLIPDDTLPGGPERFAQRIAADRAIRAAGWRAVGLDHYALPDDAMARAHQAGTLKRNFQGYTTDTADILVGLGTSAISSLPQGYAQNHAATPAWRDAIRAGALATARGIALSDDDRRRRAVIEALMCHGSADAGDLAARHAAALDALAADGILTRTGGRIALTDQGMPFVRTVAAVFDTYLAAGRYSRVA